MSDRVKVKYTISVVRDEYLPDWELDSAEELLRVIRQDQEDGQLDIIELISNEDKITVTIELAD